MKGRGSTGFLLHCCSPHRRLSYPGGYAASGKAAVMSVRLSSTDPRQDAGLALSCCLLIADSSSYPDR